MDTWPFVVTSLAPKVHRGSGLGRGKPCARLFRLFSRHISVFSAKSPKATVVPGHTDRQTNHYSSPRGDSDKYTWHDKQQHYTIHNIYVGRMEDRLYPVLSKSAEAESALSLFRTLSQPLFWDKTCPRCEISIAKGTTYIDHLIYIITAAANSQPEIN